MMCFHLRAIGENNLQLADYTSAAIVNVFAIVHVYLIYVIYLEGGVWDNVVRAPLDVHRSSCFGVDAGQAVPRAIPDPQIRRPLLAFDNRAGAVFARLGMCQANQHAMEKMNQGWVSWGGGYEGRCGQEGAGRGA